MGLYGNDHSVGKGLKSQQNRSHDEVRLSSMTSHICLVFVLASLPASALSVITAAVRHDRPFCFVALDSASAKLGFSPQAQRVSAKSTNVEQKTLRMSASGNENHPFQNRGRKQIRRKRVDEDKTRGANERSGSNSAETAKNRAVATVAYFWWKNHKEKHKQIPADNLDILYSRGHLGDGAYGEVFHAVLQDEERGSIRAVAKRARDGSIDPDDPAHTDVEGGSIAAETEAEDMTFEEHMELWDKHNQSFQFLQVEAYINDLVQKACPEVAAPYKGICRTQGGVRWLVWEFVGNGLSLQSLLAQAAAKNSLRPLADALRIQDFVDQDPQSLQRLVNTVARQLLQCCAKLEQAGVAHRDMKPANLIVVDGQLRLIDFGAAAAMGVEGQAGYDRHVAPCDLCYAPPEQFIDEAVWPSYDVYSVGLILLRILFPPLWSNWHWHEFVDTYAAAGYSLDRWLSTIIEVDPALAHSRAPLASRARAWWQRALQSVAGYLRVNLNRLAGPGSLASATWPGAEFDQRYLDLATESCAVEPEQAGGALSMCSLKLGLEVLNVGRGGVCWDSLRGMLARSPKGRISSEEALARLEKERVVDWEVWRERRDKMQEWKKQRRREQVEGRTATPCSW